MFWCFFPRRWCWSLAFACWLSPPPFLPYAFGQAVCPRDGASIDFIDPSQQPTLGRPNHLSCLAEWQASMHHVCHGNGKLRWSLCSRTFALMWHLGLQQVNVNFLLSKWAKDPPKTTQNRKHLELVPDGPRWGFSQWGVSVFLKSSATFCRDRNLFSQWLTFKLLGITYLVEKKLKLLFHGPLAEWGKVPFGDTTSAFFTSKWAVEMFQTWCIWVLKNRWVFGEETIRKPIAIPFENTRYPSLSSSFL